MASCMVSLNHLINSLIEIGIVILFCGQMVEVSAYTVPCWSTMKIFIIIILSSSPASHFRYAADW